MHHLSPNKNRIPTSIVQMMVVLLFCCTTFLNAQIFEPEGLNLPGQWNNYVNPPAPMSAFGSFQQASGTVHPITTGARRWQTRIHSSATGGDTTAGTYTFLFTSGPQASPYDNKWAGVDVVINQLQTYQYNTGNDNSITLADGKVYTMNWADIGYQPTRAIFMETSAEPVTILTAAAMPAGNSIPPQTPVNIDVTLSAAPSPEELFYVRYSTDFFATSSSVPLTINGTTGTGNIPGFAAGLTVTYYIFSTTISNPVADFDLVTLEFLNDDGLNFRYDVQVPTIAVNLGDDLEHCPGIYSDTLNAGDGFASYLWSTGDTTSFIVVNSPGEYSVMVTQDTLMATDTINILEPELATIDLGSQAVICSGTPVTLFPGIEISPVGDSLTIVYNALLGQSQLGGATSVYMHSSFEYEPFGGAVEPWIGNWGVNDGLGQMTSLGEDKWTITINIYDYYGIDPDSTINGLFIVFRNATGTATGKDDNGNNIFLNLNGTTPASSFAGITAVKKTTGYSSILWSTDETTNSITVSSPGTYWVTMTSDGGCSVSDTIVVTTGTTPTLDLGQDLTICDGVPVTVSAAGGFAQYEWSNGNTTSSFVSAIPGIYELTVTNTAGCEGSDQITLLDKSTPEASFTASVDGLTVSFVNETTGNATSYSWDFQNNGSIDNSSAGDVTFSYPAPGLYTVRLIATNSCGSDTAFSNVTVTTIGLEDLKERYFSVYPNPAADHITVSSLHMLKMVRVFSPTGQLVQTLLTQKTERIQTINLETLSPGIYLLEVSDNLGVHYERFVRQ